MQITAPLGHGFRQAKAEKPQATEHQHRIGGVEGEQHGHRGDHVAEQVVAQDPHRPGPQGTGRLHEQLGLHLGGLVAHHPEVLGHIHHTQRGGRIGQALAQQEGEHHREQQHRQGVEGVHQQHQAAIQPAPQVAAHHPQGHPDHQGSREGDQHHLQGHTAAGEGTGAHITAEAIGAAPVLPGGSAVDGVIEAGVHIRQHPQLNQQGGHQGHQGKHRHDHHTPAGHAARERHGTPALQPFRR